MRFKRSWAPGVALLALAACQDAVVEPDGPKVTPPTETSSTSAPVHTGYVMRDGDVMKVTYELRHGRAVFEGDIDLGPADSIARTREELLRREPVAEGPSKGVVAASSSRRWNGGQVAYVIESTFPDPQRVYDAIAHIEGQVDGVYFTPRASSGGDYIIFRRTTDPNICGQSAVGRQGGGQVLLVHDYCGVGTVIHELGHALGFWHEQSRCDRDYFVEILWANIKDGYSSNFDSYCGSGTTDMEQYDEGSVMHYRADAFSKNGQPTIRSRRGLDYLMGQRNGLSTNDVYTINRMYRPYGPAGMTVSYPGNVPTISWNSSVGASYYSVEFVEVYEENDYERGFSTYTFTSGVGSTTGLSLQDGGRTWTGVSSCNVYDGTYGSADYRYYYDVYAHYPNGVISWQSRHHAEVGTC